MESKTYYLISPEKVVAWYGFEVEATSLEEAKQKLLEGEYTNSRLMGIDVGFGAEEIDNVEELIQEVDIDELINYGYPKTRGYYEAD